MSCWVFSEEDKQQLSTECDYLSWCIQHPNGYVMNARKDGSQPERFARIHHPSCKTISTYTNRRTGCFTNGDYLKVTSDKREELIAYAARWECEEVKNCSLCLKS